MRVFKNKTFSRFARKARIGDGSLCIAVLEARHGLISADLGGGVIKQRIARRGQGRSTGFRVLIAFKSATRAVFVHGFAKNELDNIDDDELAALKKLAKALLGYDHDTIGQLVAQGTLTEVNCDQKTVS